MSIVQLYGSNVGKCGYCHKKQWHTYGINCTSMTASDYEGLMIRGWRRCGDYYYKPDVAKACCKLNTIRCDAPNFQANPEQAKVMKKLANYIEGVPPAQRNKKEERKAKKDQILIPDDLQASVGHSVSIACQDLQLDFQQSYVQIRKNPANKRLQQGDFSITSAFLLKKQCNLPPNQIAESLLKGLELPPNFSVFKVANGFINLAYENPAPPLEDIEQDPIMQNQPHEYRYELVSDAFDEESFEIYRKYQVAVHKDKPNGISKGGYTRFLCNSSLQRVPPSQEYPLGLGSNHMKHYIDNKLVAVGVLDILPSGVSSVYFIYDPDYKFLAPGKFGAIKEIELVQSVASERFRYYYLGYYIDSCHKMRYKGDYRPCELVCPQNYLWVPIEDCLKNKEAHGFLELAPYSQKTCQMPKDPDMDFGDVDLFQFCFEHIKLSVNQKILKLNMINPQALNNVMGILLEIMVLIGKRMSKSLVFAFG